MELPISSTTLLIVFSSLVIGFVTFFMPAEFYKWLSRKRYQYEVTTSLYMLTPTEKFIFNSVVFLLLSLTSIAAFLYLPDHIVMIARRAFYYYAGDENSTVASITSIAEPALETLRSSGQHAREVLGMDG